MDEIRGGWREKLALLAFESTSNVSCTLPPHYSHIINTNSCNDMVSGVKYDEDEEALMASLSWMMSSSLACIKK